MSTRFHKITFIIATVLTACNNSSTNTISGQKQEMQIPTKEDIDSNFHDFIDKFSTNFTFQVSRTKFPLKTNWYDLVNDRDSIIYTERSKFEMMDLRKKNPTELNDQWKQKIVIGKDNASATIEIRGIENGIMVDYIFEKINGAWMLIEIDNSST